MKIRQILINFLLITFNLSLFSSCQDTNNSEDVNSNSNRQIESINDPNNYSGSGIGTYNEKYGILLRQTLEYDIKPEVSINNKIDFSFFNYGEDLKISTKMLPNVFLTNISQNIVLEIIQLDDISNFKQHQSESYGTWGEANIITTKSHVVIKDVIISPLAAKFILGKTQNDSDALVLVRFLDQNNVNKDYVFLGNYLSKEIIERYYRKIKTSSDMYSGIR